MKAEAQIREKAKKLYTRSMFSEDHGNSEVARSMQVRADLLLEFVLEMNFDETQEVWQEAAKDYKEWRENKKGANYEN